MKKGKELRIMETQVLERVEQMFTTILQTLEKGKNNDILTSVEVFDLLTISRNTFDKLIETGELKAYRVGRKIYCKKSEIMEMIERNQIKVKT